MIEIKAVKGNCEKGACVCDICKGVAGRIFKIRYETPKMEGRAVTLEFEEKEVWVCHSCVKDFMAAIIDARTE